jgi:hypothetical protein
MSFFTSRARLPWRRWRKADRVVRRIANEHLRWLESEGRVVRDGKVTRGRDGWLFLANDSNDVIAQQTGERRISDAELEDWVSLLERRTELASTYDAGYFLMVAPDTHSVYPEKLPPGMLPVPTRPVHQVLEALRAAGSDARVLYPLEELLNAKARGRVCSRIDAHWTHLGAYVAYSHLLDELSEHVAVRRLDANEVSFVDCLAGGDLGFKMTPARLDTQPFGIVRYPEARLLYDNCVDNTGAIAVTVCPEAPPTVCLLLGDSYAYPLLRFLSESFGRLVAAHSACVDSALLQAVQPDVVVSLMAERFLAEVPDDDADPGIAAHEQAKRAAQRMRAPLVDWAYHFRPSPRAVERLRAHFLAEGRVADAAMVSVLAYAGLLPRELTSLVWADVGAGALTVRAPSDFDQATQTVRVVSLIPSLADDLAAWRRASGDPDPDDLVFPGRGGSHWAGGEWAAWSREVFTPAVRACGLDVERPHDLRHTYCTLLLHAGLPPREVARRVGEPPRLIRALYAYLIGTSESRQRIDASDLVQGIRAELGARGPLVSHMPSGMGPE